MGTAAKDRRSLREPRRHLRPVEYPELLEYRDAIRHSYWLHTEYNLSDDVQDFLTRTTAAEKGALKNAMLAIAQVEVAVKTFWGDLYRMYPKPEIGAVGYTFAESEVRHQDAYAHLLEVLGLNREFARLEEYPALNARVAFLEEHLGPAAAAGTADAGRSQALRLLLFSAFIEHVSLFSQFLVMKAFNRQRNLFRGIANIVEATSKEEQIHGMFGYHLVGILKEENPDWFDDDFSQRVKDACLAARETERDIVAWIFEAGELDYLTKETVHAFLDDRFNYVLEQVGVEPLFSPDQALVDESRWFEEEILAGKHYDFFHKRPTLYSKKTRSITAADLF